MKQEGEGKEWNDPFFSIGLWKVLSIAHGLYAISYPYIMKDTYVKAHFIIIS